MAPKNTLKLVASIALCQFAGIIGSLFTAPAIATWYAALEKPSFSPPNWVFAPVWILLFTLMGISLYLVLQKGLRAKGASGKKVKVATSVFAAQLALNALWSVIFFGMQNPLLAFLEILILWAAILLTMRSFYAISKPAGILLAPYLLWVSFAAVLNLSIWLMNA